jgi:hypothetical protein
MTVLETEETVPKKEIRSLFPVCLSSMDLVDCDL